MPIFDPRLSTGAILREDVFAAYLANDMERLQRAERNLEALLQQRPSQKAGLIAWQASAEIYRAVRAHEENRPDRFEHHNSRARALFSGVARLNPESVGEAIITAGSYVILESRLPEQYRGGSVPRL
jgi:hypothetical protein